MDQRPADYVSYLLRVWRSNGEGPSAWRASLENPHTGERMGFADMEGLFSFLRQHTTIPSEPEVDRQDKQEEAS
jgi:hypothetical protein